MSSYNLRWVISPGMGKENDKYIQQPPPVTQLMKNRTQGEQIQISSFIKEPTSLKLLILAGTNIKSNELLTVSKCTSLIKLDLSGNFLSDIPIKFATFTQIKILYLHDNQLTHVDIRKTTLEYISLFKNMIQQDKYRRVLIQNNSELKGIDFNIITQKEIYSPPNVPNTSKMLPIYSEIKWPIVQISSTLQHEEDYLNLLKAEIFVINNVYKRTVRIENIENIFKGVATHFTFSKNILSEAHSKDYEKPSVIAAAKKWIQYTQLKKKLRLILQKKGKEHLLMNKVERMRKQRSPGVDDVLSAFIPLLRLKMKARSILERNSRSFRQFIPANRALEQQYLGFTLQKLENKPVKLYFRQSEQDILSKVCLYAKRLFFQEKDYDLCDQFNNLFTETSKKYIIYRKNDYLTNNHSWLLNSIHQTTGYILRQEGIDRKHFLYSRTGHKKINIKSLKFYKLKNSEQEKVQRCNRKLVYKQSQYDKLVEYEVKDYKILKTIIRIVRYINAGNSSAIVSNETAYFQTQIITEDMQDKKSETRVRLHIGLQFFTRRVIAANVIQRFFRKKLSQKRESINLVAAIRVKRAEGLIRKWLNRTIFEHRMISCKISSYQKCIWKHSQVYLYLDVYMNMPQPTNFLRYQDPPLSTQHFYNILHKGNQIQIVQVHGRKWVKVIFPSAAQALKVSEIFRKFTYRYYYNGFSIKLFALQEIKDQPLLQVYEKKLRRMFGISIVPSAYDQFTGAKNLWVENPKPFFIWSQIEPTQSIQHFSNLEKKKSSISIFIYNKHQRPLKVSCDFYWINAESIYPNKKTSVFTARSAKQIEDSKDGGKQSNIGKNGIPHREKKQISLLEASYRKGRSKYHIDKPSIDEKAELHAKRSMGGSRNTSLTRSHRTRIVSDHKLDLLSETLNIRRK